MSNYGDTKCPVCGVAWDEHARDTKCNLYRPREQKPPCRATLANLDLAMPVVELPISGTVETKS